MLKAGMRSLSDRERAAIALRESQGLSTAEVAHVLGSTESTVARPDFQGSCESSQIL